MTGPLVTVITPTFNHVKYIRQCVESVRAQTYPHWEQLIVDDASTDGTVDVVRQIEDDRIHVTVQEHRGILRLAETYNDTLARARGELIAILEGDDYWPPDKLDTLVPAFADPEVVLAYGTTVETTAGGTPTGYVIPEPPFVKRFGNAALFNTPVAAATQAMFRKPAMTYTFPCSVVIRRRALETIGGFQHIDGIPFIDYQTFLTLSLIGKFFYTPRVMGYWRRHGHSATALRDQDLMEIRLLSYMRRFLETHRTRMAMSPRQEAAVAGGLRDWEGRIALYRGRAALVKRRWAESRRQFRMALKSSWPLVRIGGAVGMVASYLHADMEWLVAIRAFLFDRQARTTGVRRRFSDDADIYDDAASR